jgi:S1-C subfamily serine protease
MPALAMAPATGAPARYVALVEASRSGPSVRPLFLGRLDPVTDVRWQHPLVSLGGMLTAQPGSFVFTLDAELIGLVVADRGLPALVPASLVLAASKDLMEGRSRYRGDFGVGWQHLTPALAKATGALAGVVVGGVEIGGPADTLLHPGDVVQAIDGVTIRSLADARLAEAGASPGSSATVRLLRGGEALELALVSRQATPSPQPIAHDDLGLTLRSTRSGVDIVRVMPGSAADLAGLMTGDVITHVDREAAMVPGRLRREWASAESGRTWLLVVARSDTTVVLALVKP